MDGKRIIQLQEQLESARTTTDGVWADVARYVVPELNGRFGGGGAVSNNRPEIGYALDTMPSVALDRCAAIMTQLATPHEQEYHDLRVSDDVLNDKVRVQRWLASVNQIIRRRRYGSRANFRRPADAMYRGITGFGSGAVMLVDGKDEGPKYAPVPIYNLFLATDPFGLIDRAHRRLRWDAKDIVRQFDPARVPEKIRDDANKDKSEQHEIIHAIWPADTIDPLRKDAAGMPFRSYYVLRDSKVVLEEGGYWKWPLPVFRYQVTDHDPYGWSPAMKAMGDIKSLQAYAQGNMEAAHAGLKPVLLAKADAVLPRNLQPGTVLPGGLDYSGNPTIRPLIEGRQFQPAMELMASIKETINDHFLVRMIQFLVDSPQMTATEVLQNAREQGILFAPTANLLYGDEALMGMIGWELDNASRNGALPEPPPELMEAYGDQASIEVEFDSPMTRNMQADKAVGIIKTYEFAGGIAQYDPTVMDSLDHDEALRYVSRFGGAPPTIMRPRDEAEARRAQRAQAQEAQQMVEALPKIAGAAKDMSMVDNAA